MKEQLGDLVDEKEGIIMFFIRNSLLGFD